MNAHNFLIVNGDTDSISFKKPDESLFTKEERVELLRELNSLMPSYIIWEDDKFFNKFIVVKTKNYIMLDESSKLVVKGSALKATTKEPALKRLIDEVIRLMIEDKTDDILSLYYAYTYSILNIVDMKDWCSKHTITKAVLEGEGTAQVRIREALKGRPVQEGDKVYQFVKTEGERCLLEDFDGTYDKKTLLGKLYDTLCIFETVIDIKHYPNFSLKKNARLLVR